MTVMDKYYIGSEPLSYEVIERLLHDHTPLALSEEVKTRIQHCRDYLDNKVKESDVPLYGITSGFGSLCNCNI